MYGTWLSKRRRICLKRIGCKKIEVVCRVSSADESRKENTYWSREIASILQIAESTLRKWCQVLESHGYRFIRDDQERRAFTDHDAIAMRHFKDLTKDKGVSLEIAAKAVVERFNRTAIQVIAPSDTIDSGRYEGDMDRIFGYIERQERFNAELVRKLDEQQRYIEESIQRRDEQLTAYVRDALETKKELAAAKEKKWWKFWGRGTSG